MARTQYYRYNPETDNYERIFPTFTDRLRVAARYLLLSLAVGIGFFLLAYYVFDTPGERHLREENALLKQQYELLNRRLENSLQVMENIRSRDDNFYRVMLQMEPLSDVHRYAGLNNEKRYRALNRMSDDGLVKFVTQRVDLLERELYAQSQSFDQLKQAATQQKGKLEHIPSTLPVSMKDAYISGGYGMRRDPINGIAKFHAGLDFAAVEGTPVYATADGKVITANRHNTTGNIVEIDHGYNYKSRYMHLSYIAVKEGATVNKGDMIGRIGSTGKSTGPHLHYEVRFRNEPQNPVNYSFSELSPDEYSEFATQAENAAEIMD